MLTYSLAAKQSATSNAQLTRRRQTSRPLSAPTNPAYRTTTCVLYRGLAHRVADSSAPSVFALSNRMHTGSAHSAQRKQSPTAVASSLEPSSGSRPADRHEPPEGTPTTLVLSTTVMIQTSWGSWGRIAMPRGCLVIDQSTPTGRRKLYGVAMLIQSAARDPSVPLAYIDPGAERVEVGGCLDTFPRPAAADVYRSASGVHPPLSACPLKRSVLLLIRRGGVQCESAAK